MPGMGTTLEVQVLPRVGHNDRSEAQLRKGDRPWDSSVERRPWADVQIDSEPTAGTTIGGSPARATSLSAPPHRLPGRIPCLCPFGTPPSQAAAPRRMQKVCSFSRFRRGAAGCQPLSSGAHAKHPVQVRLIRHHGSGGCSTDATAGPSLRVPCPGFPGTRKRRTHYARFRTSRRSR